MQHARSHTRVRTHARTHIYTQSHAQEAAKLMLLADVNELRQYKHEQEAFQVSRHYFFLAHRHVLYWQFVILMPTVVL